MSTMRQPVVLVVVRKLSLTSKLKTASRVARNRPGTIVGWTSCTNLISIRPMRSRSQSMIRPKIIHCQLACSGSGYRTSLRKCAGRRLRRSCRTRDGCQPTGWEATQGRSLIYNSNPLLARILRVPVALEVLACRLLGELVLMHHNRR